MWPVKVSIIVLSALVLLPVAAQQMSDPTAPPVQVSQVQKSSSSSNSNLSLQAVVWVNGQRTAQINGERYHVGDSVGAYEVMEIALNQVVLKNAANDKELKLAMFTIVTSHEPQEGKNE